jgi:hypothetical protein
MSGNYIAEQYILETKRTETVSSERRRTLSCNNAGAWRNAAKRQSSAPSRTLAASLRSAGQDPPPNEGGGYTPGRPQNGFDAHHIVPAGSRRASRAQAYAWLCGLGEAGTDEILVNNFTNGIFLRGTELKAKGDGGAARNSTRYANLSEEGKDRAYHPDTYGNSYLEAIADRLRTAISGDCSTSTERAAAVSRLVAIKQMLDDGEVPGK